MADSHAYRHIGDWNTGGNAKSHVLFKSPITFVQISVWLLLATLSIAGLFVLPYREASFPVVLVPDPEPVSLLMTGNIKPVAQVPGITILQRSDFGSPAPVASGANTANGFAITLGVAQAFSTLSKRFEHISTMNKALFQNLEPRAIFIETTSGLSARLLAGPFQSKNEASIICGILRLPSGIICKAQTFDGDLISRQ